MVTLEEARRVIAAAEQKAVEIKHPMNIAVVDEGGNLVSHVRMDGAWIGSVDISINKAFTSRVRYFDEGSRAIFAIGRAILWNPCVQSWARDGVRRRHSADARRKSGGRRGSERRFRRAGSRCSGSWSESILDS